MMSDPPSIPASDPPAGQPNSLDPNRYSTFPPESSPTKPEAKHDPALLVAGARPVADYELVRRLGRGGFGEVWLATGPGGFDVALKFIQRESHAGSTELRSLEVMKKIHHANLLGMFGAWERAGYLIIAMERAD